MIAEIRLNKRNKTIKIVNRKNNIRLTHTGKTGPVGPKGDAGGFYISYKLNPIEIAPEAGTVSLAAPFNFVFNNIDSNGIDLGSYFPTIGSTGIYKFYVRNDPDKWSIGTYTSPNWEIGETYSLEHLANHSGNVYKLLQAHTSDADNEPGVGVNWNDYWVLWSASSYTINIVQDATSYSFQGNEDTAMTLIPDGEKGEKGDQGDTGVSTFVRVHHGSDPDVVRPSAVYVEWVGSVAPNNATVEDTWIDTA